MSEVEELVTKLTVAGERGWTVRGQPCDGDIMLEAAATITRLSAALERIGLLAERDDMSLRDRMALAEEIAMAATQGESSRGKA